MEADFRNKAISFSSFCKVFNQDKSAILQTEGEIEYIRIVHDTGQEYFKF